MSTIPNKTATPQNSTPVPQSILQQYSQPKPAPVAVSPVRNPSPAPAVPTNNASTGLLTPSGLSISGNPGTWSGVQSTPSTVSTPQPTKGLFPSVASSLSTFDPFKNPAVSDAYAKAQELNKALAESKRNEAEGTATLLRQAIPLGDQEGQARVLQDQYLKQQLALSGELQGQTSLYQAGLTGTGQQLSGLGTVAGLAPEATRYEAFSDGSGNLAPQNAAQQYAQDVASGIRTYDDAVSAMGLYGGAGKQFLDQAIRAVNPNFNFAQSQSLGGAQGLVGPQYNFATQALSNVENALNELGSLQKTSIPLWNQFANWASLQTGLGDQEATRRFVGAVQTLRNAYAQILATAKGGTPTDYSAQATAEIPDVPTPNDLAAIRHNLETLGQARIGIFGSPGTSQNPNAPSNSQYDW